MSPAKDAGVSEGTTTEPNDLLLASIPLTQATEAEYGEWVSDTSMSESLLSLTLLFARYPEGMTWCQLRTLAPSHPAPVFQIHLVSNTSRQHEIRLMHM